MAAVWLDEDVAPMMMITITMITGTRRPSMFSGLHGLADGVLVKLPPTSVSEGQAPAGEGPQPVVRSPRWLACCAVPVSQTALANNRSEVAGF